MKRRNFFCAIIGTIAGLLPFGKAHGDEKTWDTWDGIATFDTVTWEHNIIEAPEDEYGNYGWHRQYITMYRGNTPPPVQDNWKNRMMIHDKKTRDLLVSEFWFGPNTRPPTWDTTFIGAKNFIGRRYFGWKDYPASGAPEKGADS